MKTCHFGVRSAVLSFALGICSFAMAQSDSQRALPEVVVTANRMAQPVGDVVADVTIIDRDAIERAGATGLVDLLATVPGFEFARNGGVGNATSLFLRGGETRHTAVLVDGVRLDSQNTSGGANWNSIPLSQIDHIEIVRGPTSAVYGSDAVAGVIQIFTKKGEGPFSPSVALGVGTNNTQKLDFAASGSAGLWDYSLGLSGGQSEGYNIRPTPKYNPDRDGYLSNSANIRLGLQLTPSQRLELSALESRMDAQYDGSVLKKDDRSVNSTTTQSVQWIAQWTERYSSKLSLSRGVDQGRDLPANSTNQSTIDSVLWFNAYQLGNQTLSATLEQRSDAFELSGTPRIDKRKSQDGLGLGYAWAANNHTVQLSARNDVDSEFGAKTTTSAAYAYSFAPGWRASVSSASSFRAPTLYQRFSKYGVADLAPESGRNVELGVKYAQQGTELGVSVYRNTIGNLLSFLSGASAAGCPVPASGCYSNTAEAQYQGIGLSAQRRFDTVRLRGSLDLQDPRDRVSGKLLARRTTHHATLGLDTWVDDWTLSANLQLSAMRYDDAANTTVLPGYVLLGLSAERRLGRSWTLLARLDNATDTQYELASTYATPGRSLYLGLKWAP